MVLKPLKTDPQTVFKKIERSLFDQMAMDHDGHNQAKRTRGVWFLVVLAPCIASILNSINNWHFFILEHSCLINFYMNLNKIVLLDHKEVQIGLYMNHKY